MFFATVLLEKNRWTPGKIPSFKVSEWAAAIRAAGFSGLELWENHVALADEPEQAALSRMPLPVTVFNSYCTFDDGGAAGRQLAADLARRFGASGVKFNLGGDLALTAQYQANLAAWLDVLPAGCRALGECHGGTVLEDPARAAQILRPFEGRVGIIVHAFAGEDDMPLRSWIEHCGPALAHVHAASANTPGVGFLSLRQNEAVVRRRVAMLGQAGFDGTWTIEFTSGVNKPPESIARLLETAADDLQFLRETLAC